MPEDSTMNELGTFSKPRKELRMLVITYKFVLQNNVVYEMIQLM